MNLSFYSTRDYENKRDWTIGQNKPNSNPIKANFQKAKMNVNSLITKDYRKNDDFVVRINKPNLVRRRRIPKMSANVYVIEDYENKTAFRPQKNKPKQSQFQTESLSKCSLAQTMRFAILERQLCNGAPGSLFGEPNRKCQMNSLRKVVEKC